MTESVTDTLPQLWKELRSALDPSGREQASLDEQVALAYTRASELAAPESAALALRAARDLAALRLDATALAATLLSAVGEANFAEATKGVDVEVVRVAEGVRRLVALRWDRLDQERVESLRRMFVAMARDVRVVLIVLALRKREMEGIARLSDQEASRLARETLAVHAPLASRLGIWELKWQLEDAAFRVLEPDAHAELTSGLMETRARREALIEQAIQLLESRLREEGISATVKGRPKHLYSIHSKMRRKSLSLEQIYDASAVRIIVTQVRDCYAALGLVHSLWTPIPNEFDDYVAMPKENGYQSLHTAVIGPEGRPVEVQIRTAEMHRLAELGVAAHWAYKEGRAQSPARDQFTLLRQLLDWEREVVDHAQLVDDLGGDLFSDRVLVFTRDGDVVDLPRGATPVDFAYRVHTLIGHRCRGARVNEQIVPLDHELRTGDRVEILTQREPRPSRDWMNPALGYLKTATARSKVRHYFRQQERPEAVVAGREIVHRELKRLDLASVALSRVSEALGYDAEDDLFAAVGYGDRGTGSIAACALELEKGERRESPRPEPPPPSSSLSGICLEDVGEVEGQRARCCLPVPGDDVVGFVTRGRGLTIHRRACQMIRDASEPERIVEVQWGSQSGRRHSVVVEVMVTDRAEVLGDLLKRVSQNGAYISTVEAQSSRRGDTTLRLALDCVDAAHVARVLEAISRHPDVLSLRRSMA